MRYREYLKRETGHLHKEREQATKQVQEFTSLGSVLGYDSKHKIEIETRSSKACQIIGY